MLKHIMSIVIRNRRNNDKMVIEILNFLSDYSYLAERASYFLSLDKQYERQEMHVDKDGTITHVWKEW